MIWPTAHPTASRLSFTPGRSLVLVPPRGDLPQGAGVSIDYTFQVKAKLPQLKKAGKKGKKS